MISIRDAKVSGKRVFLRVDFNVPIKNGVIEDDTRIKKALPTIRYLVEKKAKVIVATHLGKPDGHIITDLSTTPLAQRLAKLLHHPIFATDHIIHPLVHTKIRQMRGGEILVLGNLRWHTEEKQNNDAFAKELSKYADLYVNDAFGASHRAHSSVEAITKFLPSYSGFLLEQEITTLELLVKNPTNPFLLIMGGAKVGDKTKLIKNLIEKVDRLLIGGAIANTFLKARGEEMSESLVEPEVYDFCTELMDKYPQKIVLPTDFVKEELSSGKFKVMDIGPKTRAEFTRLIGNAKTVFWNGNLGYTENEKYAAGTKAIASALSNLSGTTVVAGGDTVGYVMRAGLDRGINFISTGGGATLSYLAGEDLPAVTALNTNNERHLT